MLSMMLAVNSKYACMYLGYQLLLMYKVLSNETCKMYELSHENQNAFMHFVYINQRYTHAILANHNVHGSRLMSHVYMYAAF